MVTENFNDNEHPLVEEQREYYNNNYIEKYIEILDARAKAKHETTIDYYDYELEKIRNQAPDLDWNEIERIYYDS